MNSPNICVLIHTVHSNRYCIVWKQQVKCNESRYKNENSFFHALHLLRLCLFHTHTPPPHTHTHTHIHPLKQAPENTHDVCFSKRRNLRNQRYQSTLLHCPAGPTNGPGRARGSVCSVHVAVCVLCTWQCVFCACGSVCSVHVAVCVLCIEHVTGQQQEEDGRVI